MTDSTEGHDIAQLRKQAARATELEREVEQYKRDLAFTKAGVTTDGGLGELIAKTYDGEPTPDAIREYAGRYGYSFDGGQSSAPDTKVDPQQAERIGAAQRADQAMAGGQSSAGAPVSRKDWMQLVNTGKHQEAQEMWAQGRVEGTQAFGVGVEV